MRLPRLLLVTDRRQLPTGRSLIETVARCADAGATVVVLRELDLGAGERADLASALAQHVQVIAAHQRVPVGIGVHLASHQAVAGVGAGPHGRSCHGAQDVAEAIGNGAAWVTVSPVAATASKPGYGPPLGIDQFRRAVEAAGDIPLFALGGIEPSTVAGLRTSGAYGVAVMGAVMRAVDPAGLVSGILAEVEQG